MEKVFFEKDHHHVGDCWEVFDNNYRHIGTVHALEVDFSFEIVMNDGVRMDIMKSDIRSTFELVSTAYNREFFGGANIKVNDQEVYVLYFDEGKEVRTTFYKSVYKWVHKIVN